MMNATRSGFGKRQLVWPFLFLVLLAAGCRKDSEDSIPGVTGIDWRLYGYMVAGENIIRPLPAERELKLNADRTFSLNLGTTSCTGTYTWTPIDATRANVAFTVIQGDTNDLFKNILQGVNVCNFYNGQTAPQYPGFPISLSAAMEFSGSGGYIRVYK